MSRVTKLRVVGQDPSLRNWGIASGIYDIDTGVLTIDKLDVLNPIIQKKSKINKQNSLDIESAVQLYRGAYAASMHADVTFIEVPHGSQSGRAAIGLGVCCGILGSLRAGGIPFFPLTAKEVKLAATGNPEADKKEMIDWAVAKHPEAPWPRHTRHKASIITEAIAEHQSDAIAAIYAGLSSSLFQQNIKGSFYDEDHSATK